MSYHFTKIVHMSMEDAIAHVTAALTQKGFGVLGRALLPDGSARLASISYSSMSGSSRGWPRNDQIVSAAYLDRRDRTLTAAANKSGSRRTGYPGQGCEGLAEIVAHGHVS